MDIPIESLVFEHQAEYYHAIQESTHQADSAPFIVFMLRMIQDALGSFTPEAATEVTPEVRLLPYSYEGEISKQELKKVFGLKDDEHFRKTYLLPALDAGLIEMTIPEKPRSSKQRYRLTAAGHRLLSQGGCCFGEAKLRF